MHIPIVFLHIVFFRFQQNGFISRFTQKFNQSLIFWQTFVGAEKSQSTFFTFLFIFRFQQVTGIGKILGSQHFLCIYQTLYSRAKFFEKLIFSFGYGAGNNQRCSCIINQYRVHFVDNGIMVFTLYQIQRARCHVIAQVIKPEFIVGSVGYVSEVSLTAFFGIWTIFIDAVYR